MLLVAVAFVALTGCSRGGQPADPATTTATSSVTSSGESRSGPHYAAVDQIGAASDSVIMGTFTRFDSATDDGGDSAGSTKIPMRIGRLNVQRSDPKVPAQIEVAIPVPQGEGERDSELTNISNIRTGVTYVIFGEKVAKDQRGGLQQYGDLYNIVGHADGIFAVSGDTATSVGLGVPLTSTGSASPLATSGSRTYSVDSLMGTRTGR